VIAIAAGAASTWLIQHFPGLHLNQATLGATITDGIVFVIGAAGTFLMHSKWLTGWQQWESSYSRLAAAEMPETSPLGEYDPAAFAGQSLAAPGGASGGGNGSADVPTAPEAGSGTPPAESGAVLPSTEEELTSVPESAGGEGGSPRPESSVRPDEPVDELEPTEM
jgi:hypothetical protein